MLSTIINKISLFKNESNRCENARIIPPKKLRSIILIGAVAGISSLAACTNLGDYAVDRQLHDVKQIRQASFVGSPFTQELARYYRDFAIQEHDVNGDYPDALHFARKGLLAAKGDIVQPEPLQDWAVKYAHYRDLTQARSRLMRSLDIGARDLHPRFAASAQAHFDCWVEEQEEDGQPTRIRLCQDRFIKAMIDLERAMTVPGIAQPSDIVAQRVPPPIPSMDDMSPITPDLVNNLNNSSKTGPQGQGGANIPSAQKPLQAYTTKYLAFFNFDSADITPKAQAVLRDVVNAIGSAADLRNKTITITGHADTSGPEKYNNKLGLRRAQSVKALFIKWGVSSNKIRVISKGEKELLVRTKDNVKEPSNRRTEITFE